MKELLKNVNQHNDIKPIIQQNITSMILSMADKSIIEEGIKSLDKLNGNKRFIPYCKTVDKIYTSRTKNNMIKVPVILGGAIILDKYKEESNNLTNEDIALLAHFSYHGGLDEYISIFNHETLSSICNLTKDWRQRNEYLRVVEDFYDMFYIESTEYSKEEIQSRLASFIKQQNKERMDYLYYNFEKKIEEIIEKEGIVK